SPGCASAPRRLMPVADGELRRPRRVTRCEAMRARLFTFRSPLPLLLACMAAGCAHAPPRTAAERAADNALAVRVEAALEADPQLFARHIAVPLDRGKGLPP